MKIIIITMILMFVSGCSSQQTRQAIQLYKDPNIQSTQQMFHLPELGTISAVEVGENLYTKFYYTPPNTYKVKLSDEAVISEAKDRQYAWLLLGVVGVGIMELTADTEAGDKVLKDDRRPLYYWSELGYKMICGRENICLVDKEGSGTFTHRAKYPDDGLEKLDIAIPYELELTPPQFDEDDFKYIALYQGKVGNKIRISFREFISDMARPAFTQDIEYELAPSGSTIIGFKGLRIQVHKASNLSIEYTVLHDYS